MLSESRGYSKIVITCYNLCNTGKMRYILHWNWGSPIFTNAFAIPLYPKNIYSFLIVAVIYTYSSIMHTYIRSVYTYIRYIKGSIHIYVYIYMMYTHYIPLYPCIPYYYYYCHIYIHVQYTLYIHYIYIHYIYISQIVHVYIHI